MLKLLNHFLHLFHIALIVFVVGGWLYEPVRIVHLAACALVLISWFGIGILIQKPGYCIITDIQFRIRSRLGIQKSPQNYMAYLCEKITGRKVDESKVDIVTQAGLYIPTLLSCGLLVYR